MTGNALRTLALACGTLLLACAEETADDADVGAVEDTTAAAVDLLTVEDLTGTWRVVAVTEAGDSVPPYDLVATADPSGWSMIFPDRDPIPTRVVGVGGDSIVLEAGPYESVLRPGVEVRTNTVARLSGETLVTETVAHYTTAEADSVVRVRGEGTRAP